VVRDLHPDLKTAKNAINDDEAWLVLFEVHVTDTEVFRLVNNEQAITFASNVYSPFPIGFEQIEETSAGDLPYINVVVSNQDRMISAYLESHGGLLDRKVVMRIVHQSNLASSSATIESTLMIREVSITEEAANFRLSHHPFFEVDLPHQTYYRHRCRWAFASGECGWVIATGGTGSGTACDKTLEGSNGCEVHNNAARFGGFPGIPRRRI